MNVVVLSDLNWEQHLRGVTYREVESATLESIKISRYASIHKYLQIVIEEEADLVLVAGDVTGDGSCGHGFHHAFMIFLSILEQLNIPSCFISGNHDEHVYYDQVLKYSEKLKFSNEISNVSTSIGGLRILGVPYETTYSKSKIKDLISTFRDEYDIVLAHAQLKRRIRLFELKSRLIVTGHYDRKLFGFKEATLVSLDNDDRQVSYATIEIKGKYMKTAICIRNEDGSSYRFEESSDKITTSDRSNTVEVTNRKDINLTKVELCSQDHHLYGQDQPLAYLKYIRGNQYLRLLHRLDQVKKDETLRPTLSATAEVIGMQITANYKVSTSLVIDYLGKRTR
jgi:Icc-related predicted phosphoesterase